MGTGATFYGGAEADRLNGLNNSQSPFGGSPSNPFASMSSTSPVKNQNAWGPMGSLGGGTGASNSGPSSFASDTLFHGNHNITDPYQANQNMASAIASFGAQSLPGAAAFQQGLFEPGFNAAENAYLNSESDRQTRMLNQQMAQLGNKFGGTPFHSGYLNSARELGAQAASNLGQTAQSLALNRQGLAANAAQRILGSPMQATEQAQNVVPTLLGMISNLQQSPLQGALSYLNQSPIMGPTIIPGAQTVR